MVDSELHLEAVRRCPFRHCHETGIVDENLDLVVAGEDLVGGFADRRKRPEVKFDDFERCVRVFIDDAGPRASALAWLRAAITTCAPLPASALAVSSPRPPFAPVTTATLPV